MIIDRNHRDPRAVVRADGGNGGGVQKRQVDGSKEDRCREALDDRSDHVDQAAALGRIE
jgi:hypothetical protein